MRTSFAVAAGLVAIAHAGTTTITDTVDVTITSCEPQVTNCPYKGGNGADGSWSDWVSASTTTSSKPVKVTTTSTVTCGPSTYSNGGIVYTTYTGDCSGWADWTTSTTSTKPVKVSTTSASWDPTWSDWVASSSTTSKPVSAVSTSTGTWADWSSTTLATSTPVAPASTSYWQGASTGVPVAPASYNPSSTGVAPATYTGAANVNSGSFALAGLAAAAVMVMA